MSEGVRRLLVAMTVVDTKYRCSKKKPLMVVPFVVDERELLKQRGQRKREREKSTTKETADFVRSSSSLSLLDLNLKKLQDGWMGNGDGMET
jgi:hypothetical protein